MKFVITKEKLAALMQAVSYIVEEAVIECSEAGWSLKAVDAANVACVMAKVPSTEFSYFSMNNWVNTMAVGIARLSDKLGAFDNGSELALEVDENRLLVSSGGLKFKLALLDPAAVKKPPRIPELDLPVAVVLDNQTYQKAVKALSKLDDDVIRYAIEADDAGAEFFVMMNKGDIDSAKLRIPTTELRGYKPGNAASRIAKDYVQDIAKSIKGAEEVRLEIGKDYPMILKATVQGVETEYIVAPRVENDD
jgi:proliferating cell nuclear antigen